jgi:hypothetical protein
MCGRAGRGGRAAASLRVLDHPVMAVDFGWSTVNSSLVSWVGRFVVGRIDGKTRATFSAERPGHNLGPEAISAPSGSFSKFGFEIRPRVARESGNREPFTITDAEERVSQSSR